MTMQEVRDNLAQVKPMLSDWSIVALEDGKIDGPGYGTKITPDRLDHKHIDQGYIGEKLVMEVTIAVDSHHMPVFLQGVTASGAQIEPE